MSAVERNVKVVPSEGVASIVVHMKENNKTRDLKAGEVIHGVAGEAVKGLS